MEIKTETHVIVGNCEEHDLDFRTLFDSFSGRDFDKTYKELSEAESANEDTDEGAFHKAIKGGAVTYPLSDFITAYNDDDIVSLSTFVGYFTVLTEQAKDTIEVSWHVDDVLERASQIECECSVEQAYDVLYALKRNHDANHGISWETIDAHLGML